MKKFALLMVSLLCTTGYGAQTTELASAKADEIAGAKSQQMDDNAPSRPAPAPLEVRKGEQPLSSLSISQRKELTSEFGGILYMALQKYSYEKWPGKEMSDCSAGSKGACYECEMITGHANAFYYFYRDASQKACTLQSVDVQFNTSDPTILKDFRRTAHSLFGPEVYEQRPEEATANKMGVEGPDYRWTTTSDLAYLYMDHKEGTPQARFQWRRSPLFSSF